MFEFFAGQVQGKNFKIKIYSLYLNFILENPSEFWVLVKKFQIWKQGDPRDQSAGWESTGLKVTKTPSAPEGKWRGISSNIFYKNFYQQKTHD